MQTLIYLAKRYCWLIYYPRQLAGRRLDWVSQQLGWIGTYDAYDRWNGVRSRDQAPYIVNSVNHSVLPNRQPTYTPTQA
jgi:hypothetical protein